MLKQAAAQSHHALLRIHRPGPHRIVTREQFDSACAELANRKAPITANRESAWAKFVQYRSTYDESVFRLGQMMNVPQSNWP